MKVEMETGRDGALCLRLVSESPDENRILTVLDGAQVNTQPMNVGFTGFIVSKPMALKAPPVTEAAPEPER